MCVFKGVVLAVLVCIFVEPMCASIHPKIYRTISSFRKCLANGYPLMCVKEASLQIVNETLVNDKPMMFYDMIEIGRNPNYNISNDIDEHLPTDLTARNIKLDEILHEKIENYFKSRTIKFIMAPAVEGEVGRKKGGGGGGGKKGGMMMMGMVGMACMMGQMMMGKVAFMAGTALIMAKVALFMTAMMGMKKMGGGGGGGGEAHVVYAAPAEHSHGGGGWHRSLDGDGAGYRYPDNAGGY
ncbi:hypothetical protein WA026_008507 [Henosepilachna vigintioctopunctata]|uniref:Uncharacterized protein n=1 Tax=Henosepilachna vigintioctopunctata TaxID=420089 RepID=A0AAW1UAM9_9CUCU